MEDVRKVVTVAVVIGAAVLIGLYTDKRGQPRWQDNFVEDLDLANALLMPDGFEHYFQPGMAGPGQKLVYTRHRYPRSCGGQITTILHRGFSALANPAPQDADWMFAPPSEAVL